jgi:hypothetical protein
VAPVALPDALPDALPEPEALPDPLVPDGRDEDDVEPEPEPLVLPEPETLPEEVDALPPSPPPLELELQPANASAPTKSGIASSFLFISFLLLRFLFETTPPTSVRIAPLLFSVTGRTP